jgi:hypothetical protein
MRVFVIILLAPFILGISPAFAATSPISSQATTATTDIATDCGATVNDNLIRAHQALAAGASASDHAALACLIAAVQKLSTQSAAQDRNDGGRVISVPATSARRVKP